MQTPGRSVTSVVLAMLVLTQAAACGPSAEGAPDANTAPLDGGPSGTAVGSGDAGSGDASGGDAGSGDGGCGVTPVGTLIDVTHFTWAATAGTVSVLERLRPHQTVATKFHTPPTLGAVGDFATVPPVSSVAPSAGRYATLSTCPGDFSVSQPNCWVNGTSASTNLRFVVGTTGASSFRCVLRPDTDYYFNIGHLDPNPSGQFVNFSQTCAAGNVCGFYLQMGHS